MTSSDTWNRDWDVAARNILDALKVGNGDRLAIIYNPTPAGKEFLASALALLAKERNVPVKVLTATPDEKFAIGPLEKELKEFITVVPNEHRKFFFTVPREHFRPARGSVHKLLCTDPEQFRGYLVSLPTDSADIVTALANTSAKALWERGEVLKSILSKATKIRVTTKRGTDVTFNWSASKRRYLISAGIPDTHQDRWDNLGGEVFTAPLHETVNGRLIIDGAIGQIGVVDGMIAVNIKDGRGTFDPVGTTASERIVTAFCRQLSMFPCAGVVGEFGVGTTPGLKLTGELVNDEKVEGTIHFAFGDSYSSDGSGGENDCDAHTDCMILDPTVEMTIDGKVQLMMQNGKFLI